MLKPYYLVLIHVLGVGGNVYAEANIDTCVKEMQRVLGTQVDCQVKLRPDEIDTIRNITQGLITDLICNIPIQFDKSEIYNHWIRPGQVSFPGLNLQCRLTGSGDEELNMTSVLQPRCVKISGAWSCDINMSQTMGIGLLGRILENYFNNDKEIKNSLSEALESLER